MPQPKRFLIRHVGNMGDSVFFIPPVLETLKKRYPNCHITFVTAWGYKKKGSKLTLTKGKWGLPHIARKATWGERNQGGFCLALLMTNPHVDQLIHWHDTKLDLDGTTCQEEGRNFPTWNKRYWEEQKRSGHYDAVWELDFGLTTDDDPVQKMYEAVDLPDETFSNYKLYFTDEDKAVAAAVMQDKPQPRIVLLESLRGTTTRGWDVEKIPALEQAIRDTYHVEPMWFGGQYIPHYKNKPLTLRQNIATLLHADVAIGVLSGPLHFAAAVGLPTITLYGDQPLHRTAPAYFLNEYIPSTQKQHRTLLGPTPTPMTFLKSDHPPTTLSPREVREQNFTDWLRPGRQATKNCLAPLAVDEIMMVLHDMLKKV